MRSSLVRVALVTMVVGFLDASRAEDRGDVASGELRAGAAVADITPPVGGEIIGGFLPIVSTQVHDPLHARCLVLDDGSTRLALVVCDLLGIHRCVSDRARGLIADRCGIPPAHVLIAATHTHSATSALGPRSLAHAAPHDPAAELAPYQEFVAERIATGVAAAAAALEPAELGPGAVDIPEHLSNRRWFKKPGTIPPNPFGAVDMVQMNPAAGSPDLLEPAGPVDPQLSFLAVRTRSGRPLALFATYGLHYVGGVPAGDISADYFAVACAEIGRLVAPDDAGRPFVALLANGASGDVNNIDFTGTRPAREPYEQMRLVAADVARRVADALPQVTYAADVQLAARIREVDVPARVPSAEELAWARKTLEGPEPRPGTVDLPRTYASRLVAMADNPPIQPVPLQVLRIGPTTIGTMPCEVFAEIGMEFKGRAALQPAMFASLAHGYFGYLPAARHHRLGGYETWLGTCRLGPAAAGTMLDALVDMTREVAGATSAAVPTPADVRASVLVPPGFTFDLVAAEPAVIDPVAVTFDELGRPYVAEYRDYPLGPPEGSPPLSRIVRLDDADGDGRYESSTLVADGIPFMQGVLAVRGGLLVTAAPDLVFLADDDGDGRADRREVVATGFRVGNPQLRAACPQLDIDNSVSITGGLSGGRVGKPGGPPEDAVAIDRRDVRIDLGRGTIAATTGFGQFGNSFDDLGHRFTASNRNPLMTIRLPLDALGRNGLVDLGDGFEDAAPAGAASRVFPIVGTNATAASHTGTHTSACGLSIFRGDLLGPDATGDAFVCEPVSHLVVRRRPRPFGGSFRSDRVEPEGVDFLAARSTFFRPVFTATAPDGSLWVVDMCRGSVEHPDYMVPGMAATIDLRAGDTAGRIWRVARAGLAARPWTPPRTADEAVALLGDPNGWRRTTAQRLLVEGRFPDAAAALRRVLDTDGEAVATVHALWTLAGLERLDAASVRRAAASPHGIVREAAARLAVAIDRGTGQLAAAVGPRLASDPDAHVRLAAALALATAADAEATAGLVELMTRSEIDPWIARAVLSGAVGRAAAIAAGVAAGPAASADVLAASDGAADEWVAFAERLGTTAAGPPGGSPGPDVHGACAMLATRAAGGRSGWFDVAFLGGLASRRPLAGLAETGLDPVSLAMVMARAREVAVDRDRPDAIRRAAVRLLAATAGTSEFDAARAALRGLVGTRESAAVQSEAVTALVRGGDAAAVVAALAGLEPAVRAAAVGSLLDRLDGSLALLDAIVAGDVPAACVPYERRPPLLQSATVEIRERAARIWTDTAPTTLGADEFADLVATVKRGGDTGHGRAVFVKHCGNCHVVEGVGHAVGPDLAEAGDRPIETIVQSIVDPNRAVEPRWEATVVVTHDGTALEGILASTSSDTVVLTRAGGERTALPRDAIDTLRASGRSLMPEGFGRQVTAAEFADLVAFLRSGRPVPATP